jgi:release factor glutamine methyltransferase
VRAEDEARLLAEAARTPAELASLVDRRVGGEPLEQVLGWAEFYGRRFTVDPGVFVPRRRTEWLVRQAAAAAPTGGAVLVDLCCGSGAVGAAVAAALAAAGCPVELHAADLDPAAVACARRNLAGTGGRVYQGELYRPLPARLRGRVDLLVANVPYVPTGEIGLLPAEARLHEPRLALDGGPDGLAVLRRLAAGAARWLAPGGHLLVETSQRQAPAATGAVAAGGLVPRLSRCEQLDATVVIGTRPGAAPAG